jgi:hypothetical protein
MKVYVNGFWPGFIEKTDIVHVDFFMELFKKVFNKEIEISDSISDSQILLESIFTSSVQINEKKWEYSFLFSGESGLNGFEHLYDCVLWGDRTHGNIVNCPLFSVYLHCANLCKKIRKQPKEKIKRVPPKNICTVVSNLGSPLRNELIEKIHQRIPVDTYGRNHTPLEHAYHTQAFRDVIGEYKFVITMENSVQDTYITEKITHGFLSNTIPIYWGSPRVGDYFNNERFINIQNNSEEELKKAIDRIEELCNNEEKYLEMINKKALLSDCDVNTVAREIRNRIFPKSMPSIDQVYLICSPKFEPLRYEYLKNGLCKQLGVNEDNVTFKCPTFGHTITDEKMKECVKTKSVLMLRRSEMKKSEISLMLNFKAILEEIEKTYKGGNFLILESDVILRCPQHVLASFIKCVTTGGLDWDFLHIGEGHPYYQSHIMAPPFFKVNGPISKGKEEQYKMQPICVEENGVNLVRKYYSRCTDSFVFTYNGVTKLLQEMNAHPDYNLPLDNYISNILEENQTIKHYWSTDLFFVQGSHYGAFESNIQRKP